MKAQAKGARFQSKAKRLGRHRQRQSSSGKRPDKQKAEATEDPWALFHFLRRTFEVSQEDRRSELAVTIGSAFHFRPPATAPS